MRCKNAVSMRVGRVVLDSVKPHRWKTEANGCETKSEYEPRSLPFHVSVDSGAGYKNWLEYGILNASRPNFSLISE